MQYKVEFRAVNDIKTALTSILSVLYPNPPKAPNKSAKDPKVTPPPPPPVTFPKTNQPINIGNYIVSYIGAVGGENDDTFTFWNKATVKVNRKIRKPSWTNYGGGVAASASVGEINPISWGETIGLYPTNGDKLYTPEFWTDLTKIDQLLRCRKAVSVVGKRNTFVHSVTPSASSITGVVAKVAPYHVEANFPALDAEIADPDVKFFYLAPTATTITPSIDKRYYTPTIVKAYGPFYNTGGGDAPKGDIYVIFYKAVELPKPPRKGK
jgi:hypothetical protein